MNIERVPLPDRQVDVVISNCVINLSDDKSAGAALSLSPRGDTHTGTHT
ncbi:hypothetical protein AB0C28_55735 [Nonomuraea sp. NPDC048892]